MEELPVMQSLLSVLHDRDRALVKAVIDDEFQAFSKSLVDFKPLMGVIFSDRWDVCPSFEDFAKPKQIEINDDALLLAASPTPFVPTKFLSRELDKRQAVVDFLSSLAMFFKLAASLEGSDTPLSQLTYTAIRGILPAFQLALFSWMSSKIDCRRIFLQGSSAPFAYTLVSSSPWCPSLFPLDTVLELVKSPALQGKQLMQALGWTKGRDSLLRNKAKDISPRLPGLLPGRAGFKRGRHSSSARDPGPSTSSYRPAKRRRGDPLPRRDAKKPFRGSRGSRRTRGASSSAKGATAKQHQA